MQSRSLLPFLQGAITSLCYKKMNLKHNFPPYFFYIPVSIILQTTPTYFKCSVPLMFSVKVTMPEVMKLWGAPPGGADGPHVGRELIV
jgi:hypothetical protein